MSTDDDAETWREWGVERTWGPFAGSVARMTKGEAQACAREWPGTLVSRVVTPGEWTPEASR